jgi:hypothetical protein
LKAVDARKDDGILKLTGDYCGTLKAVVARMDDGMLKLTGDYCGTSKAVVAHMDDGILKLMGDCCGTSKVVSDHRDDVEILGMEGVRYRQDRVVVVKDVVSIVSCLHYASCLWNIIPLIECLLVVRGLEEGLQNSMSFPRILPLHIDF